MASDLHELIVVEKVGKGVPWEDGTGADYAESLLKELAKLLPRRTRDPEENAPLPPIARLGAEKIGFGSYEGTTLDEIPIDYLDWLCRWQEDFQNALKNYLKHPELESWRGCE